MEQRESALTGARACAGSVELNDGPVATEQESVAHTAGVNVAARDRSFGVDHIVGPVLGAKFIDHGCHLFAVGDGNGLKFSLCASSLDMKRGVLEHILVPLCIRPLYRH